jgi:hypothetical protein
MTQEEIFIEKPLKEGSEIKKLELLVEGYYLTRSDRQDNQEVILSKGVILGKTDSKDNWYAITEEEGEKLRDEVNARLMAEMEAESERMRLEQDATR